ncbi:MAG: HEPN domain-containing protein [Aquamicrobium sp.]|uniref:HEPN domain-containing protein n=1 Tax=Aquamicrobium sp. TaxID=1872579 RepID=UPI00349E9A34|nr:HEPN domain-containing protein [Aquamicrobium sp.]MCO5155139.1 HEPN domain-containing protein [Aquamicrobium sp.]
MKDTDFQRMIDTATSFFLAAERCAPELKFGPYGPHSPAAPRIVCYALSVELALKLLLRIDGIDPKREHDLKGLFEKLPDTRRATLVAVDECVDEISEYFHHWRYPYEKEWLEGNFDNPRRAFIACHKEIRRAKPELVSCFERDWGRFEPDYSWAWPELEIRQAEASLIKAEP